jgi:hypothetical protein
VEIFTWFATNYQLAIRGLSREKYLVRTTKLLLVEENNSIIIA